MFITSQKTPQNVRMMIFGIQYIAGTRTHTQTHIHTQSDTLAWGSELPLSHSIHCMVNTSMKLANDLPNYGVTSC